MLRVPFYQLLLGVVHALACVWCCRRYCVSTDGRGLRTTVAVSGLTLLGMASYGRGVSSPGGHSAVDSDDMHSHWYWKWCTLARPREQLFRFLHQSVGVE